MIRMAIVEDEKIYVDKLMEYIQKLQDENGYQIEVKWFRDGCDITDGYDSNYDIILMDIQMKFLDGMSAARKIRELDQDVIIIFITNMTDYAIRGYEVGAMDYIVKPVSYFAFSEKLKKAIKKICTRSTHYISVPVEGGIRKIDISTIYYVESHGHNLCYKAEELELEVRGTMNELEKVLSLYDFFRCSKSFLVNMQYVEAIQENQCIVHGERLSVGRTKKKEFMQKLLNYMREVM